MLVSKIIKHLQEYHKPNEHLMIDWLEADSFNGDSRMTRELWIRSCQLQEQATESIIDRDYAAGFVYDAEREITEMEEVKREQIKQDNREPIDDYNAMSDAGMSESDFR